MSAVLHMVEAAALWLLLAAFRLLPLDASSWVGGGLGRLIGPFMRAHKTALSNLKAAFPELPENQRRKIVAAMWENLGRVAAEFAHLPGEKLMQRVAVSGIENLPAERPLIFISGHVGNWELAYPLAQTHGIQTMLIYRHLNNQYADRLVAAIRKTRCKDLLPKGPKGAVKLARALKDGLSLAMLVDQKMNEGVAVPFFGREAMTAPAVAQLALKYGLPIVPARVMRRQGAHFEAIVYPPLAYAKTGDEEKDIYAILSAINALLESWIRERPEQWFWVHKRWPN